MATARSSATYTVQEGDPDLSDGGNASANFAFTDTGSANDRPRHHQAMP